MDNDSLPDLKLGALFMNHWKDWIFIIILIVLWGVCLIITPFQRYVGAANFVTQSIKYPYKSNTIPFQAVPIVALVVPLIFIFGFFLFRRKAHDLHHAFLGLLTTVALTALITDAVKIGIGRPRPHFYARCFGSTTANAANFNETLGYGTFAIFTAVLIVPALAIIGSFAGLGYLAMYLGGKIGIFDHKGHSWKMFPLILPLLGATFIAITRVDDYWHHWTDVCTGAAIGLSSAYFCYRQHFPSLFDDSPNCPYPSWPRRDSEQTSRSDSMRESYDERPNDLERGSSQIPML